jgi:hypothetical protein
MNAAFFQENTLMQEGILTAFEKLLVDTTVLGNAILLVVARRASSSAEYGR